MQIFFPKEREFENRVSILPETVKRLVELGFKVEVEAEIGKTLYLSDDSYKKTGAIISKNRDSSFSSSDITCRINKPEKDEISSLKKNSVHISFLDPFNEIELVKEFARSYISCISMELIPRTARAQKMDALSSQANLGGYAAVLEASRCLGKSFPMMMTAAGTISPSKVFVIGVGVAGLQAIATAKRMGAIVFATDVRMVSKEQVESLGGKFLTVEGSENLETEEGYAKEASDVFKKKQEELLTETLKKIDIVICTALIPGKKAPLIIKDTMIDNMQPGSVIYDLAASQGGNSAYTKVNEIVEKNGVKILGDSNILNKLPTSSSTLYAKNLYNFVLNLYDKKNDKININLEDEIIKNTLVK